MQLFTKDEKGELLELKTNYIYPMKETGKYRVFWAKKNKHAGTYDTYLEALEKRNEKQLKGLEDFDEKIIKLKKKKEELSKLLTRIDTVLDFVDL